MCGMMINLVILTSQCLKDNVRSLQKKEEKKKKITIFVSVLFINVQVEAPLLH